MTSNIKISIVTTLMPRTHYARYLIEALSKRPEGKIHLFIYSNKEDRIKGFDNSYIKQCWSQNLFYPFQITRQVIKDSITIIHLQHEINMYGGPITAMLFPVLVVLLKLIRKKVVVTMHAVVPKKEIDLNFLETFSWLKNKLMTVIVKVALFYTYTTICWFSDVVIVHSNCIKSGLVGDYNVRDKKIFVIPHGVPVQNFHKKGNGAHISGLREVKNRKTILYFGYIVRRKGLEYLIDAFEHVNEKYKDYVLVLAGGTLCGQEGYAENLKKTVKEKGLWDRVIFTGFVEERELRKLFISSDFVVLPAIYSISASGPLAQAIGFHKPVIGPDLGTFREEINNGVDGLLYQPKNVKSLVNAMLRLIESPELLKKMSENMRKKAEERSWPNIALRTIGVYATLVQSYSTDRHHGTNTRRTFGLSGHR